MAINEKNVKELKDIEEQISSLNARKKELQEKIIEDLEVPEDWSGSKTFTTPSGDKLTVTARVNQTIDADKLKEIAAENNITDALGIVFNWKPSVVKKEWDKVAPEYQAIFKQAITEKIGSKSIKIKEAK